MIQLGIKRGIDLVGASLLLVALGPVMAVTALAVRSQFSGPVIFRQTRYGLNGKKFNIYKFKTMRDLPASFNEAAQMSSRLTPLSRWLRRSSLDELPQLINVLKGDMSLVGPRPDFRISPDKRIYAMRPGITGLSQINGRNSVSAIEAQLLDRDYLTNWSLGRDFSILAKTIPVVLGACGYIEPDHPAYLEKVHGYAPDRRVNSEQGANSRLAP